MSVDARRQAPVNGASETIGFKLSLNAELQSHFIIFRFRLGVKSSFKTENPILGSEPKLVRKMKSYPINTKVPYHHV